MDSQARSQTERTLSQMYDERDDPFPVDELANRVVCDRTFTIGIIAHTDDACQILRRFGHSTGKFNVSFEHDGDDLTASAANGFRIKWAVDLMLASRGERRNRSHKTTTPFEVLHAGELRLIGFRNEHFTVWLAPFIGDGA